MSDSSLTIKASTKDPDNAAVPDTTGSLRLRAYEEIKRRIITTRLRPGEYINVAHVSSLIGIGKTPVHEALNRLALEGMVEIFPRKGVIVRPVSINEVLEIAEVRLTNEALCASLAAERATTADIAVMQKIIDAAPMRIQERDVEALMNLDREFHCAISAAARNRTLADVLLGLHERSLRFWFISLSAPEHMQQVQEEHMAIFHAIQARDPIRASEAVRDHIQDYIQNITRQV